MKKSFVILVVAIVGFFSSFAVELSNPSENGVYSTLESSNPDVRDINGIPSSQDIGGVDVEEPICGYYEGIDPLYKKFVLTNYNPFPVTVLYEYGNLSQGGSPWSEVGICVLPAATNGNYPKKEVEFGHTYNYRVDIVTITRKVGN